MLFRSITEEVKNSGGLLTFEKKYLSTNGKTHSKIVTASRDKNNVTNETQKLCGSKNGMQNLDRIMPAQITKNQRKQIEKFAKKIFQITNSKGVVRIDFMIDTKSGKVYANEINSIPGSLSFYLWQKFGIAFDKLLEKLIDIATRERDKKEELLSVFKSNVIKK